MEDFNETSWGYGENSVSFSNGSAHLKGPIWGVDCSVKYETECIPSGIQIITDPISRRSFDLIIHDDGRLIVKQNIPPYFLERLK